MTIKPTVAGKPTWVSVHSLILNDGAQIRVKLDNPTVDKYAELMREEGKGPSSFPPPVVFTDGKTLWLADGFHRLAASARNQHERIKVEVRQGTLAEAVLYSITANATRGLPLASDDRQRAATLLLQDPKMGEWSDREIGRRCGIDGKTVAKVRASLNGNCGNSAVTEPQQRTYTTKHGTTATMKTEKIGKANKEKVEPRKLTSGRSTPATQAAPVVSPDTAETDGLKKPNDGKGIMLGHEAINCLQRIPKNDPHRVRGFQIVLDWIVRSYIRGPESETEETATAKKDQQTTDELLDEVRDLVNDAVKRRGKPNVLAGLLVAVCDVIDHLHDPLTARTGHLAATAASRLRMLAAEIVNPWGKPSGEKKGKPRKA